MGNLIKHLGLKLVQFVLDKLALNQKPKVFSNLFFEQNSKTLKFVIVLSIAMSL